MWSLPSMGGYSYCRKESVPPMLLLADRVFGSPVPSFIYFEFYDSPVTIKVEAYFSDFQIGKIYFYFLLVIDKSAWAATRSETSYSGLDAVVRTPTRRNGPGAWLWLTAMIGLFVTSNQTELMPQSSFIPIQAGALFGKYHLRDHIFTVKDCHMSQNRGSILSCPIISI